MDVQVDETRKDPPAAGIDLLIGVRRRVAGDERCNRAAANEEVGRELTARRLDQPTPDAKIELQRQILRISIDGTPS
jgi:hypothetical protein